MTQEEILQYNKLCAEFLGLKRGWWISQQKPLTDDKKQWWDIDGKTFLGTRAYYDKDLLFHSDWNWIMKVVNEIFALGFRKYSYTHEEHSRCVFTDMAICYQKHDFGGGNIVADSGRCNEEKEAVVQAINQFLIWYNNEHKS